MRTTITLVAILLVASTLEAHACPSGPCTPPAWRLVYQPTGLQAQFGAIKPTDASRSTSIWMDCTSIGAVSLTFKKSFFDPNTFPKNPPYRMRVGTRTRNTPVYMQDPTGPHLGNRDVLQTEAITDKPLLVSLRKSRRIVLFIERDAQETSVISIPFNNTNLNKFFESCGM